ncbi:uncharacterized protein [Typha angustifolia]|uniref:uncharacterized protein n=1 Tax=Typha angustifolia TaxID=59011 RepID=UPI003C2C519E
MSSSYTRSHAFPIWRATSSSLGPRTNAPAKAISSKLKHYHSTCTNLKRHHHVCESLMVLMTHKRRLVVSEAKGSSEESPMVEKASKKRGTIVGAVSLIVGTSIGSGILAIPQKTSPAGFVPSAVSIVICWLFLVIEALLLAEINTYLWKKRKKDEEEEEEDVVLEVISLRTMAQETLGEWGGNLATITYLFLAYTSMVAYTSKSGEVISHLINLPASISGDFFTLVVAFLIFVGGTQIIDQVNQLLTISMIGLLIMIEVIAIASGGGSNLTTMSNWEKVPPTIPVIIFSLVYHDIAPVICAYLGGDLARIRLSIILGSFVPLISLLVWDDIALGLSSSFDGFDPLDLVKMQWSNMSLMVETFSLLAVGTSLIGTLLGASQFFIEQLKILLNSIAPAIQTQEMIRDVSVEGIAKDRAHYKRGRKSSANSKLSFFATSLVILPTILISTIVPNAFSLATDIAGGYCMMILYGALPPMMAWAMHFRLADRDKDIDHEGEDSEDSYRKLLVSSTKPILVGTGLFSFVIVVEQILQDVVILNSYLFS